MEDRGAVGKGGRTGVTRAASRSFEILDALAAGDAGATEDVMRAHIRGLWAARGED